MVDAQQNNTNQQNVNDSVPPRTRARTPRPGMRIINSFTLKERLNRLSSLSGFNQIYNELTDKITQLYHQQSCVYEFLHVESAAEAGDSFLNKLQDARNAYIASLSDKETFINTCTTLIKEAHQSAFAKQPIITRLLYQLAYWLTNIFTLGNADRVATKITGKTGFFQVPRTDADRLLDDLDTELQSLSKNNGLGN